MIGYNCTNCLCPGERLLSVSILVLASRVLLILGIYCHFWPFCGRPAGQLCLGCLPSRLLGKMARCIRRLGLLCIHSEPETPLTAPHHCLANGGHLGRAVFICPNCILLTECTLQGWLACALLALLLHPCCRCMGELQDVRGWAGLPGSCYIFPVKFEHVWYPHL